MLYISMVIQYRYNIQSIVEKYGYGIYWLLIPYEEIMLWPMLLDKGFGRLSWADLSFTAGII